MPSYQPYLPFVDISTLLFMLGIDAKERSQYFSARCPSGNHSDDHPSWVVYKESGVHKCFSCGFQGNLDHLCKSLTGSSIYEFLDIEDPHSFLFERLLKDKEREVFERWKAKPKARVVLKGQLNHIKNSDLVRAYLLKRGIEPDSAFVQDFGIKWFDQALINGVSYMDRLWVPIKEEGQVISVELRDFTEDQAKKVLYPKAGSVNTLFNIDNLNFDRTLFLVEGIFDIPHIYNHVTQNVTCVFGASLTNRQKELIKQAQSLVVFPDDDDAGDRMIVEIDKIMETEFWVMKVRGKDPGDSTIDEINTAYSQAQTCVEYLLKKHGLFRKRQIEW